MLENILKRVRVLLFAGAVLAAASGPAHAVTYNLVTGAVDVTMPDATVVSMWGYGIDPGPVSVPGPTLNVPTGDNLTINLTNNLPVPVSIVIPGLGLGSTPTPVTEGGRVRSFTTEAAANGGVAAYTFTTRPGTFLYESGTDPAQQIPMGLYGAVTVQPSGYAQDEILLMSEVDPAHNASVFGSATGISVTYPPATSDFEPRYFMINGVAYDPLLPSASVVYIGNSSSESLLRLINAGSFTRMPTVQGFYLTEVAEDGYSKTYPQDRLAVLLTAGKTKDVVIGPLADGNYAFYDRRLYVSNAGSSPGGMLAMLNVGDAPPALAANIGSFMPAVTATALLTGPADGAVIPVASEPTFSWTGTSTDGYVVQFSKRADFKKAKSFSTATNELNATNNIWKKIKKLSKKGRPAYWRVLGADSNGNTTVSGTSTFVVVRP